MFLPFCQGIFLFGDTTECKGKMANWAVFFIFFHNMNLSKLSLIIFLFFCFPCFGETRFSTDIQHVEPTHWWLGLKNKSLQIMVHGKGIGSTEVSSTAPGWKLQKVHRSGNPNYLFLDFEFTAQAKPGVYKIGFKSGSKTQFIDYEIRGKNEMAAGARGFDASDVMYLIMPDRFSNGNPGNDFPEGALEKPDREAPFGRHGGDLAGIENHLDYIRDLGVTAIWLNPVIANNQTQSSYHGYSFTDFYKIDTRLGTLQEYKRLIEKCHQNGLKMVQDMVANHIGTGHWWMSDMPAEDWVHPAGNPLVRTNFKIETVVDPNASPKEREIFEKGWFDVSMPDLNQTNLFVAKYLIQNTIWWICETGIDGIRMDTYPYNDKEYMARWCREVLREFPAFGITGEIWVDQPAVCAYFTEGGLVRDGYKGTLPSSTDFPLYFALSKGLSEEGGWEAGLNRVYVALSQDFLYKDAAKNVTFIDNHDLSRFITTQKGNVAKLKQGLAMLLTIRGIPQLYYGAEILMAGDGASHPDVRKDFPGGWPGDSLNLFSESGRRENVDSVFRYFQHLLKWRKTSQAVHKGSFRQFIPVDNQYAYLRKYQNEMVLVVVNGNDKPGKLDLNRLADEWAGKYRKEVIEVISGEKFDLSGNELSLPARGLMIFEFKN